MTDSESFKETGFLRPGHFASLYAQGGKGETDN